MTDTYQAVYDATRSRLSNCDVGAAIREVARIDASQAIACLQQDFSIAAQEMARPSVLYRPSISIDGDQWCALYGGVAGFGDSPDAAMRAFDKAWCEKLSENGSGEST